IPAPGVLANDASPQGNLLTVSTVAGTSHGIVGLNSDGSFIYTPNIGYLGPDSFTYLVTDSGAGLTSTATVNLLVTPRLSIPANLTATPGGNVLGPVQVLTFGGNVTGGTFTLALNGATTSPISFGTGPAAQAILQANIQTALDNLVGTGNASVDA